MSLVASARVHLPSSGSAAAFGLAGAGGGGGGSGALGGGGGSGACVVVTGCVPSVGSAGPVLHPASRSVVMRATWRCMDSLLRVGLGKTRPETSPTFRKGRRADPPARRGACKIPR